MMQIDAGNQLMGADAVLVGINLSKTDRNALLTAWRPLVGRGLDAQMKVLRAFVPGRDLEWPWFDDCRARFEKLGRYPDVTGWDVFETGEGELEPVTPDDALNWIDIDEARTLLKEFGAKPAGRKNADVYAALHEHVPFERWRPLALAAWKQAEDSRIEGPDADQVEYAKMQLLVATMSAADYVAHRVEQLREMVQDGGMSGIRVDPEDALAQAAMHDPSPYCPHRGLPPFFPGDRSGVAGTRAERVMTAAPAQQIDVQHLANATARGIADEKTRESLAVILVVFAVVLAWVIGAMADSVLAGVVVMLLLFVPIWKSYRR